MTDSEVAFLQVLLTLSLVPTVLEVSGPILNWTLSALAAFRRFRGTV